MARRLRDDVATASTALIAVTGWGQAADKQAATDAGFDRHLLKPLDPEELLEALAALPPRRGAQPGGADAPFAQEAR